MTGLAWQPSLFSAPPAEISRVVLDDESWVDHAAGWMPDPDRLFDELVATLQWTGRDRVMYGRVVTEPRLTARWTPADGDLPGPLGRARQDLSERYDVDFDSAGFNLYRNGADSVAWHRDRIPASIPRPVVALISLGSPRPFRVRPRGGGASVTFRLGHGDLLVTGGLTQRRWEHSVPKVRGAAPRMSAAFRHSC